MILLSERNLFDVGRVRSPGLGFFCRCAGSLIAMELQKSKVCVRSSFDVVYRPIHFRYGKRTVSVGRLPRTTSVNFVPLRNVSRRKRSQTSLVVTNYGFSEISEPVSTVSVLLTQLASALAWAAVAYLGYKVAFQDERPSPGTECETCGGTGLVDCFCTRWSDGDRTGCSACNGSLKTICHSCRGGGTRVPIEAKVYIRSEQKNEY